MVKKIMMDMKLNSKRATKTPPKEKKVPPPRESPHEKAMAKELASSPFIAEWKSSHIHNEKKDIDTKDISAPHHSLPRESLKRLSTPHVRKKFGVIGKPLRIIFLLTIVLGIGYWGAMYFEKTTIRIQERHEAFTFDHTQFTGSKDPQAPLHFEIMISSDTDSRDIILTESQDVSLKAKGTVMLYNEYSTKPQTITANSFLADENGKTYRTDKAVTIPGYKGDATKIIPGQIPASITAFLPGDSYNGTPTDFTISGFKNTAKFKKIYGKATSVLSGGAQGLVYVLGATQKESLNAAALSSFQSRLLKKINAEVPKGYILYPDALTFSYAIDEATTSPTPNAKVGITGTLSAIIFKEIDLTRAVVKNVLPAISTMEQNEIEIPDISKLLFAFVNPDQSITKDLQSVPFTLTGTFNAIWHPDQEALELHMVGIPKTELPLIFKSDPGIKNANARLFPPWRKYLPEEISRIHIEIE